VFLPKMKTPIKPDIITIEINIKKIFPLLLCTLDPFMLIKQINPSNSAIEPVMI
jgi:hypothetical protein